MIQKLMAIYDRVAEAHLPCICVASVGEAERSFKDACAPGQDSNLSKHPEDFSLYYVGEFNQLTGEVTPNRTLICVGAETERPVQRMEVS